MFKRPVDDLLGFEDCRFATHLLDSIVLNRDPNKNQSQNRSRIMNVFMYIMFKVRFKVAENDLTLVSAKLSMLTSIYLAKLWF